MTGWPLGCIPRQTDLLRSTVDYCAERVVPTSIYAILHREFGIFAEEYFMAIRSRLADGTAAKYRSHLDSQLLPQWSAWPLIGIFNSYVEIEKWVSELHEDYAESTVSSIFATFPHS